MRAWQDPTHKRAISEATFLYANKSWRVSQGLDRYPITCDFDFSYGYRRQSGVDDAQSGGARFRDTPLLQRGGRSTRDA